MNKMKFSIVFFHTFAGAKNNEKQELFFEKMTLKKINNYNVI